MKRAITVFSTVILVAAQLPVHRISTEAGQGTMIS